jgi:hypothetical protein
MINVVIFASAWDIGGQGWRIKRAFERYEPEFSVRSIHSMSSYFRYPQDLPYEPASAYRLFANADVAHMRNGLEGLSRLTGSRGVSQTSIGLVLHHHGTRFRAEHARLAMLANEAKAQQIASTLDLCLLEPNVSWLPSPFDASELASYRPLERTGGPIRIAHAPTNRQVKSTVRIMDAIRNLVRAGYNVIFDLIERTTYEECLRRKAKADILVDQLELGIGNNALEAFGMSIPVAAGITNQDARQSMLSAWGSLPFYETNEQDLEEHLSHLIRSSELRAHWGSIGLNHLLTYHEESKVASQLSRIYQAAASGYAASLEGVA